MSKKQSKAARRKEQAAVGRQGGAEQRPISEAAAPQPTIPVRQSPQAPSPALDRKALLWCLIPAVLLFLFLAFQGGGDDRVLAIVALWGKLPSPISPNGFPSPRWWCAPTYC